MELKPGGSRRCLCRSVGERCRSTHNSTWLLSVDGSRSRIEKQRSGGVGGVASESTVPPNKLMAITMGVVSVQRFIGAWARATQWIFWYYFNFFEHTKEFHVFSVAVLCRFLLR
uniref:Uncharacterized protein n=1 Tax=Nelumbo nucifera TaxID=4432 RepID=A0A822XIV4_NELNU|nr:TPA_asm: hypothetical protein HUJ06_020443 [Nelumbo nucifera]